MHPKRILIVDDDANMRKLIKKMLKGERFELYEAGNGLEAEEVLAAVDSIDLVIMDIFMPEQEGLETIRSIMATNSNIGIIAISGGCRDMSVDFLEIARVCGADGTLAKPFRKHDLLQAIQKILS